MFDISTFISHALSGFVILFAIIDITGAVPVVVSMLERGQTYKPLIVVIASLAFYVAFCYLGQAILKFLGVDFTSFAIAGALVLLAMAMEMIFDITIFKDTNHTGDATFVPLVFPLIAGPGSITTILAFKTQFSNAEILAAVLLNLLVVYLVLKNVYLVQKLLGKAGVYALRKFFGIILLATSSKMLILSLSKIISQVSGAGE